MINLSKFPYDFIIHFFGCFLCVMMGCPWWICLAFWVYLEYEQKPQVWYNELSWDEYFKDHALRDLIADILGVVAGVLCS